MFEKQGLHLLLLTALLIAVFLLMPYGAVEHGSFFGINTKTWLQLAIAIPILHQVYVFVCWRLELHGRHLSKYLGQGAFSLYALGFSIIGIARVLVVFALAWANQHTLTGNPLYLKIIAVILLLPALYLFYSVKRYFGFKRAFGIDHFDSSYRDIPMVNQGIFRFTSNGMYQYGFLLLWVPAFWFASSAALIAALFNHLYIWVHYYTTEKPDMQRIYGDK